MRTWDKWKEVPEGGPIDLGDYEATGGMAEALSRHAEEAFGELPDAHSREVAEKLFKALTEKGPDNREIRRPIILGELCAVAGATAADAVQVIETFRQPGRSFLMPPAGVELAAGSLIDISHESLIRGWQRLRNWVDEEGECARIFCRKIEAELLAIDGYYRTAEEIDAGLRGRPMQAWLDGETMMLTALN